jgi:hypothetical protein
MPFETHPRMHYLLATLLVLPIPVLSAKAGQPTCPVIFDGRIPPFAKPSDFDTDLTPYKNGLKPATASWASILNFPQVPPSLFDRDFGSQGVEVRINDNSIVSSFGQLQTTYRRTELVLNENSPASIKTFHWSVMQGNWLNLTHVYMNVFIERRYTSGQDFVIGLGELTGMIGWNWKVAGSDRTVIWQTPMLQGEWQNFAITLDYVKKYVWVHLFHFPYGSNTDCCGFTSTMKVYYSKGYDPLVQVTREFPNQNTRTGKFHVGVLRYPLGGKGGARDGTQPRGVMDSQIYGGLFIEDGSNGCFSKLVSSSPFVVNVRFC